MILLCSICPKVILQRQNGDSPIFNCPKCKRSYNLYYEIPKYQDNIESSHEGEGNIELAGLNTGPVLEALEDEEFETLDEQKEEEYNKGKIAIPKYMKSEPGKTVIEYREDIDYDNYSK